MRKALQLGEVPDEALNICMASISDNTLKQYSSSLKLWWEFCSLKDIDPFSVSVTNALKFLTFHYNKGASYSSLNTYRSAIAHLAGPNMAQDIRIQKFFKGVYMLRPSRPKYDNTWDPAIVLNYLRKLCNDNLSLELLTQKLVTLLALATGQRLQTLWLIDIDNIYSSDSKIEIAISKRTKTSARNKTQPLMQLPFLDSDYNVCVARTLTTYLEKTQLLRGSERNLFITVRKPYKKASTQTLSRWIKNILAKSGVDVDRFSPYSTRHASTSAAKRKGLNIDTIRLAAGWSKNSRMFAEIYNRPLLSDKTFAETILSG